MALSITDGTKARAPDSDAFVGIDVAFAKNKRLPISICTWRDGRLVPLPLRQLDLTPPRGSGNRLALEPEVVEQFADDAVEYVRQVARRFDLRVACVAIDAPSECCRSDRTRRDAEVALDRAGISCFATPTAERFDEIKTKARNHLDTGGALARLPHSNQIWMLVGFAQFRAFRKIADCREVYPQATVRVLGAGDVYKAKEGGVAAQLAAAARYTGWDGTDPSIDDIAHGDQHDRLDAYLAAWVAALPEDKLQAFGAPPDEVIWTPRIAPLAGLALTRSESVAPPRPIAADPSSPKRARASWTPTNRRNRTCPVPGCEKIFRRTRGGWDGHAGSLRTHRDWHPEVTDAERRRALFRLEFADWFDD